MHGADLTTLFEGKKPRGRSYFTSAFNDYIIVGDGRWLLISDNQGKQRRLYDTESDQDEEKDVASDNPDVVDRLWQYVVNDAGGTMPVFGKTRVISG